MSGIKNHKGMILIVVLWLLVILSVLSITFSRSMLVEYRITSNAVDRLKTMELAKSGLEYAIAILSMDSTNIGDTSAIWHNSELMFNNIQLGDGSFSLFYINDTEAIFGIEDENSKININAAPKEILLRLPNATESMADSIIDWRSPTAAASPQGAKDDYYLQLSPPYRCKNAPFDTIEELLLVKDITAEILFGEDYNRNGILDLNENNGDASFPPDNADGLLNRGWYPFLTIYSYDWNYALDGQNRVNINRASRSQLRRRLRQFGLSNRDIQNIISYRRNNRFRRLGDILNVRGINLAKFSAMSDYITLTDNEKIIGLVNINTAPKDVLELLPGITSDIAEIIIERRNGPEGAYRNLGDIASSIGIESFREASNYLTVRSSQFNIQSIGRLENKNAFTRLEAVVDRTVIPVPILSYRDISHLGPGVN